MLIGLGVISIRALGEGSIIFPIVVVGRCMSCIAFRYVVKGVSVACVAEAIEDCEFGARLNRKEGNEAVVDENTVCREVGYIVGALPGGLISHHGRA